MQQQWLGSSPRYLFLWSFGRGGKRLKHWEVWSKAHCSSPSISLFRLLEVLGLKEAMWDIFDEYLGGDLFVKTPNQTSVHSFPWHWKAMGASGQANWLVSGTDISCGSYCLLQQNAYIGGPDRGQPICKWLPWKPWFSVVQDLIIAVLAKNWLTIPETATLFTFRADSNSAGTSREGKAGDL